MTFHRPVNPHEHKNCTDYHIHSNLVWDIHFSVQTFKYCWHSIMSHIGFSRRTKSDAGLVLKASRTGVNKTNPHTHLKDVRVSDCCEDSDDVSLACIVLSTQREFCRSRALEKQGTCIRNVSKQGARAFVNLKTICWDPSLTDPHRRVAQGPAVCMPTRLCMCMRAMLACVCVCVCLAFMSLQLAVLLRFWSCTALSRKFLHISNQRAYKEREWWHDYRCRWRTQ